jgi:Protein trafficking PGA2
MADLLNYVRLWADNFQRNVSEAFYNMTPEKYIRLIVIIGAYALLRPYLMKLGSKFQTKEHEKEVDPDEMAAAAAISPNSLRGQVQVPEDSDEDEAEGQVTGADWGKKARRRQRQMVRRVLEAEEKLRREQQEDDEDKDIEEFLVDS